MNKNTENQRRFIKAKKEQGLRRLILWVRPEDVEPLKEISRQPHTIAKRRAKVQAEIERELRPAIKAKVAAQLERKTQRALLIQKRAQARLHPASSNRPPSRLRFEARPPATIRNRIKAAGWFYDPVAAVWHLPDDPDQWPALEHLLSELGASYGFQRLSEPMESPVAP